MASLIKNYIGIIFMLFSTVFRGQQNFINVPSSEPTAVHKIFFQQQTNFSTIIQSNTTLDIGLGKGFEAGFNILNVDFKSVPPFNYQINQSDTPVNNPLFLINGLKKVDINERLGFIAGVQMGSNLRINKSNPEAVLVYGNLSIHDVLIPNSNIVVGTFYNSVDYGGEGNRVGVWFGSEFPVYKKMHLVAESVLGNNNMSYSSLGIVYYPVKKLPVTFGVQIPNTRRSTLAVVIEFTFVP